MSSDDVVLRAVWVWPTFIQVGECKGSLRVRDGLSMPVDDDDFSKPRIRRPARRSSTEVSRQAKSLSSGMSSILDTSLVQIDIAGETGATTQLLISIATRISDGKAYILIFCSIDAYTPAPGDSTRSRWALARPIQVAEMTYKG